MCLASHKSFSQALSLCSCLVLISSFCFVSISTYQEEEHAVVVVGVVLVVHAESSIHVAQMVMVVQLSETLIGQLCLSMEAFEQVVL